MNRSSSRRPVIAALVITAFAGVAQASPPVQQYHIAPLPAGLGDSTLDAVNAGGVAAGRLGTVDKAAVWQNGALRTLDCQNSQALYSNAYGINDAMQVAGYCQIGGSTYAVVWDAAGNPTTIVDDGMQPQMATAINSQGTVVGSENFVAYVWKGGKVKLLGTLGGSLSSASAISDKGWIVGGATTAGDAATHAYVYRNGQMQDLAWGGDYSIAYGVNEHGHVVGMRYTGNVFAEHAIFDNGVKVVDLGRHSVAQGINELDQIVGAWNGHGFIYTHGAMHDLNTLLDATSAPGWEILDATAINDAGVIVGYGLLNGTYEPVVLTPLP